MEGDEHPYPTYKARQSDAHHGTGVARAEERLARHQQAHQLPAAACRSHVAGWSRVAPVEAALVDVDGRNRGRGAAAEGVTRAWPRRTPRRLAARPRNEGALGLQCRLRDAVAHAILSSDLGHASCCSSAVRDDDKRHVTAGQPPGHVMPHTPSPLLLTYERTPSCGVEGWRRSAQRRYQYGLPRHPLHVALTHNSRISFFDP
eukprot:scaffold706_cov418-Prasinococcus_capsulatus_cf.AAC.55